jgi:hypothetical protein
MFSYIVINCFQILIVVVHVGLKGFAHKEVVLHQVVR